MAHSLIRNATLIDGTGRPPVPNAGVLIEDGRVRAAGRLADVPVPSAGVTEIDAGGGFILPGFIDTHVHMMMEGTTRRARKGSRTPCAPGSTRSSTASTWTMRPSS